MTVIIGEQQPKINTAAPYYKRKIQCPGHYLIPPTVDVYLYETIPELKNCSDQVDVGGKPFKIKKKRIVLDKFGQKRLDWKKLYELKRQGIVKQPWVTASYAIENIWDPHGLLCKMCDKRCMEGKDKINEYAIKRLHG